MSKVILITGASSGIGKASAKKLLNEGHTVYCVARRVEKMKDLEDMGAIISKVDVTNDKDLVEIVTRIIKEKGKIDILFNNAGFGLYGPVEEVTIEQARYQFEVNIFGLARLTQLVIPHMRMQRSGTIINTSSMGGKVYTPLGAWYHATKHALEGWSDCLRLELKEFEINVVIIEPGAIATEFNDSLKEPRQEKSPYQKLINSMNIAKDQMYNTPNASSPASVIADVVSKAVNSNNPKTRYAAGKFAKPFMFLRKIISDKFFDKLIMKQVDSLK